MQTNILVNRHRNKIIYPIFRKNICVGASFIDVIKKGWHRINAFVELSLNFLLEVVKSQDNAMEDKSKDSSET